MLPQWQGTPADIYALYPPALALSARVWRFVDFLCRHFAAEVGCDGGGASAPANSNKSTPG